MRTCNWASAKRLAFAVLAILTTLSYLLADGAYNKTLAQTPPRDLTLAPVAAVTDGEGGYEVLNGASDITVHTIGNSHYALVASQGDDGVQIIDITNPAMPTAIAAVTDEVDGFTELDGASGITTHTIGTSHYALVSSQFDDGVQIIDITTPASPTAIAAVTDGADGYTALNGASDITVHTIGNSHYALVASITDDGVQIIDITTPASPTAIAAVTDDSGGFTELDGASVITTHTIGSSHYALVASGNDNGVQIIDITTPAMPTAIAAVTDEVDGFTELDGASAIATHTIGSSHYALVSSQFDDGVQIIDITTPAMPTAVAVMTDGVDGYTELEGAWDITTHTIGTSHYALVASLEDNGVQIIDITNPASPSAVARARDGFGGYTALAGAAGITTHTIAGRHYALVAAFDDGGLQIIEMLPPDLTLAPVAAVIDEFGGYTALDWANYIAVHTIGTSHYALVTSSLDDGVQIIDITDPAMPTVVAAVTDGADGYTELDGATGIAIHTVGNSTYALVTANNDDGVQIIDITDPAMPTAVAAVTDGADGYTALNGAAGITTHTIGSSHYALVASLADDGVQIINITDPTDPSAAAAVTDGADGYTELDGAWDITTHTIGSSHYALVASLVDDGVQIINITNPAMPTAVAAVTDGADGYTELDGARGITTHTIGSSHYALVASLGDDGVQIINITNPAMPTAVAAVTDGADGYTALEGARAITTHTIGTSHYALVAARDDGVQIIDITDPTDPSPAAAVTDEVGGYTALEGARAITTHTIAGRHYALVTAEIDDGLQIIEMLPAARPMFSVDDVEFTVAENAAAGTVVGTVSAGDPGGLEIAYLVGVGNGTAGTTFNRDFSLDTATGEITVKAREQGVNAAGINYERRASYMVTVSAVNQLPSADTVEVTINVTNSDDAGLVALGPEWPSVGVPLEASLADPDGGVSGVSWTWSRSDGSEGPFTVISGATSLTYTPVEADVGKYLRATASYTDAQGSGKSAFETSAVATLESPPHSAYIHNIAPGAVSSGLDVRGWDVTTHIIEGRHYALLGYSHATTDTAFEIFDITDPESPWLVVAVPNEDPYKLGDVIGIATHTIGSKHYALLAASSDDALQIIDITDPASPSAAADVTDGADGHTELDGAWDVTTHTIGNSHYALVAARTDDGVQIINITDPEMPTAVAAADDGTIYTNLNGASGIATHTIGSSHYALVASFFDDGVQIIGITTPTSPSAAADVTDGADGYTELDGAYGIATHTIGSSHYALVAAREDDGVQIIDITDPTDPSAAAAVTDGTTYTELDGAYGITTHTIGSSHYALVTSQWDDGVHIIGITDPTDPSPVAVAKDGTTYTGLDRATGITTHTIGSRHYALVMSQNDSSLQMIELLINVPPLFVDDEVELAVRDGATSGTVGTVAAIDEGDDTLTYSVEGTDETVFNRDFSLDSSTGEITVKPTATIVHSTKSSYEVTIKATDSSGADDTIQARINVSAIDNLVAIPGNTTVSLEWDDPSDGTINRYQYRYMSTADSDWNPDWTDLPGSGATTTTAMFTGLTNGLEYTFQLRFVTREGGTDTFGREAEVKSTPRGALVAPTDLAAMTADSGEIALTWSDPMDSTITGYQYRYRKPSDSDWNPDWTSISGSDATTTSHTLSGLDNDVLYTLELRAQRDSTNGPESTVMLKPRGPLVAPANFMAMSGEDRRVTLNWDASADDSITSYQYRYRVTAETAWNPDWTTIPNSGWRTSTYVALNLLNGTEYTFEVRPMRDAMEGPSSTDNATPEGPPSVPLSPTGLQVHSGDRYLVVEWAPPVTQDPRAPVTGYRVRFRENGRSSWRSASRSDLTPQVQTIGGLRNEQIYEVAVASVNSVGTGQYSQPMEGTPRVSTSENPPGPTDGDNTSEAIDVGPLNPSWLDSSGQMGHPQAKGNSLWLDSCDFTLPYFVFFIAGTTEDGAEVELADADVDEWQAHITPGPGVVRYTHRFGKSSIAPDYIGMHGTVTMSDGGGLSLRVRARVGSTWGRWSPTSTLFCFETGQ